ncbi:Nitrogen assimilation regulatory protein [Bhargavaea cecembensis DSE10]|uniref:Nitrogen assimilation regulatory protein n=1 Tax=Bhargavaea cecembensis DSE10 TaxID=1235279 RepID=M7NHH7_9BACL|nr:sigma 54-interacting transcriptional regulator [Bhargavaea cecembensis]EMR06692.1 Nitrogen assimilation regulatory protein [Bhargavaea cecembensis DSE10]
MQNVLVVGAGAGGTAILKLLLQLDYMNVTGIVDTNPEAPGIRLAEENGIPHGEDWRPFISNDLHMIFDVTGEQGIFGELLKARPAHAVLIPGTIAKLLVSLLEENAEYIGRLRSETARNKMIFDSLDEGMIGTDSDGIIRFFNRSASLITGTPVRSALGRHILDVIPDSNLPHVAKTGIPELNRELTLSNGTRVVTSRRPLSDPSGNRAGAFTVFRDISGVVELAEEITNLKEIQSMLEAIIHSSDDAISVVDENGRGIMINPAYTRLTGLTEADVIGKPATVDITEGESIHMKVLETGRPIRGVRMRVGPAAREVVVNVAPILVGDKLKGSIGIIHDLTEMRELADELDHARRIIRSLETRYTFEDVVGESPDMKLAIQQARLAATLPLPILLRGESGTGKEVFAQAIHHEAGRGKFVRVNCSAIPEERLSRELFGSEEPSADGKTDVVEGLFEEAHGGTLFIDEIGELPADVQVALLRVLEENEFYRTGGSRPVPVSVRVIAATNRNLEKLMREGKFREDLFHRLNRMPVHIPPLRQRRGDIKLLAEKLLPKLNRDLGRSVTEITEEAASLLRQHNWPGNVRELENVISRALIFMRPADKSLDKAELSAVFQAEGDGNAGTLAEQLDAHEKLILKEALTSCAGNKSDAAKQLGISVRTLYYKLEKHRLV